MRTDVERVLDALDDLRSRANVNACFGEPVMVDGRTVIPVARISYGFRVGTGPLKTLEADHVGGMKEGEGAEGSGMGGTTSSPLGVIESTPEGIRVEPVIDRQRVAIVSMLVGAWSLFWLLRALRAILKERE